MSASLKQIYESVNTQVFKDLCRKVQEFAKQHNCAGGGFRGFDINAYGISVKLELFKDFYVTQVHVQNYSPVSLGLSETDWVSFRRWCFEHEVYTNGYMDGVIIDVSTGNPVDSRVCFQPSPSPFLISFSKFIALKHCYEAMKGNEQERGYLMNSLKALGHQNIDMQILNVKVSNEEQLFERGDSSVGLDDCVFTRTELLEFDAEPSHFQFDAVINGKQEVIHLGCPDDVLDAPLENIPKQVLLYGTFLKTYLEEATQPAFEEGGFTVRVMKEERATTSQPSVKEALSGFISEGLTDMPRRMERVKECLPYLLERQIKPRYIINKTPVFEFIRNDGTNVYVTVVGVLILKRTNKNVVGGYSLRTDGTLEGFEQILRKLGLSVMLVLVACLRLDRKMPSFSKATAQTKK